MVAALILTCLLLAGFAALATRSSRRMSAQLASLQRAQEETEAHSRHCGVTGLANRRHACEWLDEALAGGAARPALVRVAFVPFAAGLEREAKLARRVAGILAQSAEGTNLICRIGPGDYLLALDGSSGSTQLVATARRACAALSRLVSDTQRLRIGVALAVGGDTSEALIRRAGEILELCPAAQQVALAFSEFELQHQVESRTLAAEKLAQAIAGGRIEPFFQPFVDLASGRVLGFEVLARWRDDEGHVRLPDEFLPLAEESELVGPMYHALLAAAAAEARKWPPEWTFALNLSAQQMHDAMLVENTIRGLLDAGIGPARLEIEIPESVVEFDPARARHVIRGFRERGVKVAIDNFGAGRMHLQDLATLRIDRIKVDPAILHSGGGDPRRPLGLIAAAARHLGVPVLVQGIETQAMIDAVRASGCTIGQGFQFGRPGRLTGCYRLEGALARQ